jgi:hypothetical protein
MLRDLEESDDLVVAGAICPIPDCAALAVGYRQSDLTARDNTKAWEFSCPRCGVDFAVSDDALIFRSVPKDWLLGSRGVAEGWERQQRKCILTKHWQ